ncbi:MAG: TlpA disulfide reductase family protein, partial [Planctomycetota bacterium]
MRSPILCLTLALSSIVARPCLGDAGSKKAAGWTKEAALEDMDRMLMLGIQIGGTPVQIEDQRQRIDDAHEWLERVKRTQLDLGKESYLKAFAIHMSARRGVRGILDPKVKQREATAVEELLSYVGQHGELPPASRKYFAWVNRLLYREFHLSIRRKKDDRALAACVGLASASPTPYTLYAIAGSSFKDAKRAEALAKIYEKIETTSRLAADERVSLKAYINSNFEVPLAETPDRKGRVRRTPRFIPFSGADLDGKKVSISDYRGNVVLVDFWATWCGPCIRMMPDLVEIKKAFAGQDFQVIGVSLDDEKKVDASIVRKVAKKHGLDWPHLYDGKGWMTKPAYLNVINRIPRTILLDRAGRARYVNLRKEPLRERVAELLAESADH